MRGKTVDEVFDVIVIGGGAAAASAAMTLKNRNRSCAVI
ncbi:MAG: FAD-binding protein, partial [Oscillospiraceae bacterium]|nr:FAD-binding protein [Oscillospiraceae bacterium]